MNMREGRDIVKGWSRLKKRAVRHIHGGMGQNVVGMIPKLQKKENTKKEKS